MRRFGTAAAIAAVIAVATPETGHAAAMTADMRTTYEDALQVVDEFWAANFSDYFDGVYTTPNVLGLIDEPVGTACGTMAVDNAAYCEGGDALVFGSQFLAEASELGDLFIYDVVAHEWGHAIQQRAGIGFNELGAECLAGAALGGSVRAGTVALPDGDGPAIVRIAEEMADPRPAVRDNDHGTAEQQVNAYRRGWIEGPASCVGGDQDRPPTAKPEPKPEVVAPVLEPGLTPTAENTVPVIEPNPAAPQEDAQSGYVPDFGSLGGSS